MNGTMIFTPDHVRWFLLLKFRAAHEAGTQVAHGSTPLGMCHHPLFLFVPVAKSDYDSPLLELVVL